MKKITILSIIMLLSFTLGCGEKNYKKILKKARENNKEANKLNKKADQWYKKSFENYKKAFAMDISVFRQNDYYQLGNMYKYFDNNERMKEYMYKQGASAPKH